MKECKVCRKPVVSRKGLYWCKNSVLEALKTKEYCEAHGKMVLSALPRPPGGRGYA